MINAWIDMVPVEARYFVLGVIIGVGIMAVPMAMLKEHRRLKAAEDDDKLDNLVLRVVRMFSPIDTRGVHVALACEFDESAIRSSLIRLLALEYIEAVGGGKYQG